MTSLRHKTKKFENYVDKLFLGIYSEKHHKDLLPFIQKYIPTLLPNEQVNDGGSWTAYPPDAKIRTFYYISHSYFFTKHPYLSSKFFDGHLNIKLFTDYSEDLLYTNYETYLQFRFRVKKEAQKFYNSINKDFNSYPVFKKVTKNREFQKAIYKDENSDKHYNQIEIMLSKDLLSQRRAMSATKKGPRYILVYDYVVKLKLVDSF